ncbi:hypothetical protein M2426_000466 [Pseudomonas moraviensis]
MLIIWLNGQVLISSIAMHVPVGASLLARASCQSIPYRLTESFREQARSHRFGDARNYSALHNARQLSSMRLEKPHSLSYQASTFSNLPLTLVWLASKIDDSGLWLKSLETSGKVL